MRKNVKLNDKDENPHLITRKNDALVEQTKIKPNKERFELRKVKAIETFYFDMRLKVEVGKWILGLTSFKVYKLVFILTEENIKSKLYSHEEEDPINCGD